MPSEDDNKPQVPSVLGVGKRALERVAELAREVLREEGFSEEQIEALLKRRYVREDDWR